MRAEHDIGPDLVDGIYEAAFVPQIWPRVLQALSDITGSAAGSFVVFGDDRRAAKYAASDIIRPVMDEIDAAGEWQSSGEVQLLFSRMPPAAFIYDADYFPAEVLEAHHMRNSRTRPLGIGGQVGSHINTPTGEVIVFTAERWAHNDRPSVEDMGFLNAVRPHLARAGLMAARLGLEQARATASALQAIGLPAAVLSRSGRVRATNELLDAMTSLFMPTAFGGMAIADPAADDLFRQAVAAASAIAPVVRSIPVKATGKSPPLVVHVLPLRRSAHDIFSGADILVAATAVSASNLVPSPSVLTGLFDLTPSEARLAVALTQGLSLKAFAAEAGITFATARKYLDRVYLKTGTHSQSQLVALLKGAQPPGASPQPARRA